MKTKLYCVITLLAIFTLSIRGETLTLESLLIVNAAAFFSKATAVLPDSTH